MIKQWLNKWWYVGGYVLLSMLLALVVFSVLPVSAAPPAPPTMNVCVKVAEATTKLGGLIETFRCTDEDMGIVFYQNSLGFMFFQQ